MPEDGREVAADPELSVIVVTHNNRELVGRCLSAIEGSLGGRAAQIIVVDNGSTDGTQQAVLEAGSPAELVVLSDNLGFARAVNRGLEAAKGCYLALVNSDAFPDPGCLDRLIDVLVQNPDVGMVGAKLRYPGGRLQPSAGTFPSLFGGLWVALSLHRFPGLSSLGIGYFADRRLYRRVRRVDWVCGAVCAVRAALGPMPSSSFMYGEDVEWGMACRRAGYETWLVPQATAVHIGRASVERSQDPGFAQRRRVQFELAWFARRGMLVVLLLRAVLVIHAVVRLIALGALSAVRGRRDRRAAEYLALLRAALETPAPAI